MARPRPRHPGELPRHSDNALCRLAGNPAGGRDGAGHHRWHPGAGLGAQRLLALRPLRAIGRWSYGMYLWEVPVLMLAVHWWGRDDLYPLESKVALILVTVGIAAVSYMFYELPIRRSVRLTSSPALSLACVAIFIVVALVTISLVAL